MNFTQLSVTGEDFVGLLGFASDKYAILSDSFPHEKVLNVPTLRTKIYGTGLVGLFMTGNSNGVLIPNLVDEAEIEKMKGFLEPLGVKVGVVGGDYTALGNRVCSNDNGAIVSQHIPELGVIEETLGVDVVKKSLGDHSDMGACIIATNKGFLAHPDLEGEVGEISQILKVNGIATTVNFGSPYVKAGVIANSHGYITGLRTSGIEMGRVDDGLEFI